MYVASLKNSENYKAQPYQYASTSKPILKAKAKPFPPCTHYGFNNHRPDNYHMYPECEFYGSNDHATLGHNRVLLVRGGVLAESSQFSESLIGDTSGSPSDTWTVDAQGFDDKQGTNFNANKEIVLIALKRNDVYVLDMSSLNLNGACFFAKASESVNWFTNTSVDEIRIDDSSRYPPDEFLNKDDPSRQYQVVYGVLLEMSDQNVSGLVILSFFW
ncbi:hypothetical protein Tco_0820945 [Tanacetum coccineum]|uniref:Uncharacterized protein n=1 Tax=Tanacetum coccineum TaxID=301880 RepID=A0ABQ5AF30_9ASTR